MSQTDTQERRSTLEDFAAMKGPADGETLPARLPVAQVGTAAAFLGQSHVAMAVPVPRDVRKVLEELRVLAAVAAETYFYRYPVKDRKKGTTSYIEGGTVKLANDLTRVWRNIQVDCAFVDEGSHWVFYGRVIDRENGVTMIRPLRQRPGVSKLGGADAERNTDAAFSIGVSKAERNAVLNYLRSFADFALAEAKASAVDKYGKRIDHYRKAVPALIAEKGIELKRVEAVVGRPAREWLAADVAKVVAMMNAIEDGMTTAADSFPPLDAEEDSALNRFASGEGTSSPSGSGSGSPPETDAAGLAAEVAETEMFSSGSTSDASPSAVPLQTYRQCIDGILKVARDKKLGDPEERVAAIDGPMRDMWTELMPDEHFLKKALSLGVDVARGKMPAETARKMMENLVP